MSIEINWDTLTTGSDGLALAESVRDFIHDKFQEVELPRFIRSVHVHSFEFGEECPKVELKDICDPLPDFYEHDGDEDDGPDEAEDGDDPEDAAKTAERAEQTLRWRREADRANRNGSTSSASSRPPAYVDTRLPGLRSNLGLADYIASPLLSRSNTPGIHTPGIPGGYVPGVPGGTSNLNYFHLPLSAGLSGAQTPLAAVAGGTPFSAGWADHPAPPWDNHIRQRSPQRHQQAQTGAQHQERSHADPVSRPSTADSFQFASQHHRGNSIDGLAPSPPPRKPRSHTPDPSDLQIVLHIAYTGSVRLSLTAEILLDYPMPSFVGIPLKLNIAGLSFDGVALIAYLRKRAHFCFLGPEDAETLVGAEGSQNNNGGEGASADLQRVKAGGHGRRGGIGGLLREIKVESEIGQKESGKQVLKNVGKVEKFVLEQVRRIFEDEFVYPSFWTFLV